MDINQNIPDYLVEKRNVTKLVLLTALFALVFINIFEPFGSREWEGVRGTGDLGYFAMSSLVVLMGMVVIAISRIILYYRCNKRKRGLPLSYIWYYVWIAAEVLCMSLVFCALEVIWLDDDREFKELFRSSTWNTAFVLLIPYALLWLYFSWDDKDKRLRALVESGVVPSPETHDSQSMTNFYDSKGDVKFSVKLSDLVYIKGSDNYITIYYIDGQKVSSVLIRGTMKQVEDDMRSKGVVRCHRSYMVNTKKIKLFERQKEGFVVKLDTPQNEALMIPVSKSYVKDVFELFG